MPHSDSKVIGVFAYRSRTEVVCTDVDACVIVGSEEAMRRRHIAEVHEWNSDGITIKKTRFGEIVQGLLAGGAYGFDRESYSRFLPLARELGLRVEDADFPSEPSNERRFFTVRLLD